MDTNIRKLRRDDLIYPDLCYKILGVLFDVWTNVGAGHKEKIYQRAVSVALQGAGFVIKEQCPAKLVYKNSPIGVYYFDFLIDNKIVLEIKVRNYFSKKDIEQLASYLRASRLKLGILAHFTANGVKYKRIVNVK